MKRVPTTLVTLLVVTLGTAGCSGGSEEEQIAAEACDLMQGVVDEGPAALQDQDLMGDFQELQQRVDESEVADEDMQQAMRDECPDVVEELEGMSGVPAGGNPPADE